MKKCNVLFTGKVSAANEAYLIGEDNDMLYSSYVVRLVTTDGQKISLPDESSPTGMLDGKTRYEAMKKGNAYLEELKKSHPERFESAS